MDIFPGSLGDEARVGIENPDDFTAVRSDLRNILTAQAAYQADFGRYASNLRQLVRATGFRLSPGTSAEIRGNRSGFTATAFRDSDPDGRKCRVYVGDDATTALREPGTIYCD